MTFVKDLAHLAANIIEGAAVLVILVGSIQAISMYFWNGFIKKADMTVLMQSRFKLGLSLSLSLGFLVGADVIKTAISPTWKDIGQLAAIAGIRIVLNYFLMRDMKASEKSDDNQCIV